MDIEEYKTWQTNRNNTIEEIINTIAFKLRYGKQGALTVNETVMLLNDTVSYLEKLSSVQSLESLLKR